MRQIQLTEDVYEQAKARADQEGFASVDEYVADILAEGQLGYAETKNLDHLFTPERIAELDATAAKANAGGETYTSEQVREYFSKKREAWPEHPAA